MNAKLAKVAVDRCQDVRRELQALRAAARDAKRLAEITGTPFIIVKNGRMIDLHKGRKQTAKTERIDQASQAIWHLGDMCESKSTDCLGRLGRASAEGSRGDFSGVAGEGEF